MSNNTVAMPIPRGDFLAALQMRSDEAIGRLKNDIRKCKSKSIDTKSELLNIKQQGLDIEDEIDELEEEIEELKLRKVPLLARRNKLETIQSKWHGFEENENCYDSSNCIPTTNVLRKARLYMAATQDKITSTKSMAEALVALKLSDLDCAENKVKLMRHSQSLINELEKIKNQQGILVEDETNSVTEMEESVQLLLAHENEPPLKRKLQMMGRRFALSKSLKPDQRMGQRKKRIRSASDDSIHKMKKMFA